MQKEDYSSKNKDNKTGDAVCTPDSLHKVVDWSSQHPAVWLVTYEVSHPDLRSKEVFCLSKE